MDKKNLIIKLFKSLRGEKEHMHYFLFEGNDDPNFFVNYLTVIIIVFPETKWYTIIMLKS
jgi:hypothetical protein